MRKVSGKVVKKIKTRNYPRTNDWSVHQNFERLSIQDVTKGSKKNKNSIYLGTQIQKFWSLCVTPRLVFNIWRGKINNRHKTIST